MGTDRQSDETRRVERAVHDGMNGMAESFRRAKWWAGAIGTLVLLGAAGTFYALSYLSRYALADNLEKVAAAQAIIAKEQATHEVLEAAKVGALEVTTERTHEDFHYLRDQMRELARSSGARMIPIPEHSTIKPTPPARSTP